MGQVEEGEIAAPIELLKSIIWALALAINELETTSVETTSSQIDFYSEVSSFETNLIKNALKKSNGNQTEAARRLGLKKSTLSYKIKLYNIIPGDINDNDGI
jgi:transcriptional regulator with GAF, ATPase, and Fis domain